jgi:hypothetical protein
MGNESATLKRNLEDFKGYTGRFSQKINNIGGIWQDDNYASLRTQMGELAKVSRSVQESGAKACKSVDAFFAIAPPN